MLDLTGGLDSESDQGRLGLGEPRSHFQGQGITAEGIPFPVKLSLPGTRIVSLVAGGWCARSHV